MHDNVSDIVLLATCVDTWQLSNINMKYKCVKQWKPPKQFDTILKLKVIKNHSWILKLRSIGNYRDGFNCLQNGFHVNLLPLISDYVVW